MPTASQIKQFLVGTVLPPLAGALATWIVGTGVLAIFHVSTSEVAYEVTQIATFGVVTGIAWLTSHHILTGSYEPNTPPVAPIAGK